MKMTRETCRLNSKDLCSSRYYKTTIIGSDGMMQYNLCSETNYNWLRACKFCENIMIFSNKL